ncbi:MAG: hypothetical protein QGG42_09135 [Phycisphaerae bacterium]|jgi:hypothetical protein|nr:hypothetical protein [Phycisphaerae bacterium]
MIRFQGRNRGKLASALAAWTVVVGVIALHAACEPSARAEPRRADASIEAMTLPGGKFAPGKVKLRIEVHARVPKGSRYVETSPDNSRLACYYMKGDRAVPFICGEKGDPGDLDRKTPPTYPNRWTPPRKKRTAPRTEIPHCLFSADSRNQIFAIGLTADDRRFSHGRPALNNARIRWNGRDSETYDELIRIGISPDGKHYACLARDARRGWFALMDGREVALTGLTGAHPSAAIPPPATPGSEKPKGPSPRVPQVFFSPDRTRFIHTVAVKSKTTNQCEYKVYLDNKYLKTWPQIIGTTWSWDSKRYAYFGRLGPIDRRWRYRAVIDGKESKAYRIFREGSLTFSYDGTQYAFLAQRGGLTAHPSGPRVACSINEFVVHNGVEGKSYARIRQPFYPVDARRAFYGVNPRPLVAFTNSGGVTYGVDVVYEHFVPGEIPACKIYSATIFDGREQRKANFGYRVAFSRDHKQAVYVGRPGCTRGRKLSPIPRAPDALMKGPTVIVHNGREGRTFKGLLRHPMISPDGRHAAAFLNPDGVASYHGKDMRLVVDDIVFPISVQFPGILAYSSPTTFHARCGRRPANNMTLYKWTLVPAKP